MIEDLDGADRGRGKRHEFSGCVVNDDGVSRRIAALLDPARFAVAAADKVHKDHVTRRQLARRSYGDNEIGGETDALCAVRQ